MQMSYVLPKASAGSYTRWAFGGTGGTSYVLIK